MKNNERKFEKWLHTMAEAEEKGYKRGLASYSDKTDLLIELKDEIKTILLASTISGITITFLLACLFIIKIIDLIRGL